MKVKSILILMFIFIITSCENIDKKEKTLNTKKASINLSNKALEINKNNKKFSKIVLNDSETLLEYGLNGNYVTGIAKSYPKNGTFIPRYKITLFNKNHKEIQLPVSEVIDIRLSKTGNKILYLNINEELYYYDLSSKKSILISKKGFPTFQFSNNEDKIAFFKGQMPSYDLFLYNILTKESLKVTPRTTSTWSVAFTKDDKSIYFIYSPNEKPALYKYNLKNERLTEVNSELKVFPSSRKPFEIINSNMIFKNSKNEIISSDFMNQTVKTIENGIFLGVFNKKDILFFRDKVIKSTKGE